MNILFDSWDPEDKSPFGTLKVGQPCRLRLRIPSECGAYRVTVEGGVFRGEMTASGQDGPYDVFRAVITPDHPGLYFCHVHIWDRNGDYDLFRDGRGTNIGAGELWQVSVLPADWSVPEDFRGAVYYQIFPDRFAKEGECDLSDKLGPYTVQPFADFRPSTRDASDFAGGNLKGIRSKLDYLADLGTEVIYLNPIFMGASNHRYDTADYTRIDPMLGTEEDFRALCEAAHARGMKIILDGVFSHTGKNSVYFDALGVFGGGAVSEGPGSKYYKWYNFIHFPDEYEAWWGIESLPNVNEMDPDYREFILGRTGVIAKWLALGADGYRLDVADELPDPFIRELHRRVNEIKPGAVVIGEVWEDASNKEAYGVRRKYFTGRELDGVINFPFRKAILAFASGEEDGTALAETVQTLAENYPAGALDCTMTILGNHDTERVGTLLPDPAARRAAVFLQFALPGSPVIYYGDEAGLTGGRDPWNRLPFPWGREDRELTELYRSMAALRKAHPALRRGDIRFLEAGGGAVRFQRSGGGETVECGVTAADGNFWVKPL